jgi:simple sugar transport system permease protein
MPKKNHPSGDQFMLNKIKARWASQSVDARFEFIRFVLVILLSLALTLGIVLLVSNEPLYALQQFFFGPVSRFRKMANVIEAAIPLTFLGLSVSVMFSARQFNLGSSGSLFLGGTVASVIALTVPLPAVIHPLFAIAIAGIVGGIWTSIPALIKLKYGASELVSSLMLNFVALNLGFYIILNYFRDPQAGSLASFLFPQSAILPTMVPDTRIHYGLIILIGVIIATYYFMVKTKWGYALRMTGFNKKFATYSGISTTAVILYSQFIGGMLAGFGGAVEKLGMYPRFLWQFMPAYAFDGIIVAVLAKDRPQYIPVAAFVLAYIRIGADTMSTNSDVSFQMIAIIQGLIIILIAANAFLSKTRQKMVVKEATND